ncbi:MAG: hypothetical protein KGL39_15965 [Patescibacteria group bacterium]|nr:hypothetical protein [Patescibacteria group bacterium]
MANGKAELDQTQLALIHLMLAPDVAHGANHVESAKAELRTVVAAAITEARREDKLHGWISTATGKLPPVGRCVQVLRNGIGLAVTARPQEEWPPLFRSIPGNYGYRDVTHWREIGPLPEVPDAD